MKSDVIMAICIVNILLFVWLLWLLFVPGAQTTGWETVIWTIFWLPAAIMGLVAIIAGLKVVHGATLPKRESTVVSSLCWMTIFVNVFVIGLIVFTVSNSF